MNFLEQIIPKNYYDYNCLIYPNVTLASDFKKDSFYIIMNNIIRRLTSLRPDIYFTILVPEICPEFTKIENLYQIVYKQPSYPNEMRLTFDSAFLKKVIDYKNNDWDFVYSYLPEHTLALKNLFYNCTDCMPVFFGYSCYIEIPETTNYAMTMLPNHYSGILEMDNCGTNSQAVKNKILSSAEKYLNANMVSKMDNILRPIHRGWDKVDVPLKNVSKENIIVFNHRANKYKSYPWFLEMMDELYKIRQDFKVWVPLADTPDRNYIFVGENNTREEYFRTLSSCLFGVCGQSYHTGWANSASDGMSVGVPYVFYDAEYYKEYSGEAGLYFKTNNEFLQHVNKLLDDASFRKTWSNKCLEKYKSCSWDSVIHNYNQQFIDADKQLVRRKSKTEGYEKIYNYIKKQKNVTKKTLMNHLNWGRGISLAPYRNMLRDEKNIKFTKTEYFYIED